MANGQRAGDEAAKAVAQHVGRGAELERIERSGDAVCDSFDGRTGR